MEEKLVQILTELFRPQKASSTNEQLQLTNLLELSETWLPLVNIISNPAHPVNVCYFCSNMLYTKIRRHLHQLSVTEKSQLVSYLETTIWKFSTSNDLSSKVVTDRLILALISLCIRTPEVGGTVHILETALKIMCGLDNIQADAVQLSPVLSNISLGLGILQAIPVELAAADLSKQQRDHCELQLRKAISGGHGAVLTLLGCPSLYDFFVGVCARLSCSGTSAEEVTRLYLLLLKSIRAWFSIAGTGLSRIFVSYRSIFDILASFDERIFAPAFAGEVMRELCDCVQELLSTAENPEDKNLRLEAFCRLCYNLSVIQGDRLVKRFFASAGRHLEEEDKAVAVAITSTTVALLSADLKALLSNREMSYGVPLLQFLLTCCNQPPRNLIFVTFELWMEMQDLLCNSGDDDTLCEVIREALRGFLVTVLPLLTYPDSWNSERGEHDEDRDDFLTLRDARLGIQDLLSGCCGLLGIAFFDHLKVFLHENVTRDWRRLEVTLFVLQNCAGTIKELISNSSDSAAWAAQSLLKEVCTELLISLLPNLQQQSGNITIFRHLIATANRFLGSITFLLCKEKYKESTAFEICDLFPQAIAFLLLSIHSTSADCRQGAARSFHQLILHGSTSGRVTAPLLDSLLQIISVDLADISLVCTALGDWLVVVEALTRCCVAVDLVPLLSDQKIFLRILSQHVLEALSVEQQPLPFFRSLLSIIHQILRFGDIGWIDVGASLDCPLLPLLHQLWPRLLKLTENSLTLADEGSGRALFDIFNSFVSILGSGGSSVDFKDILRYVSAAIRNVLVAKLPCASAAIKAAAGIIETTKRADDGTVSAILIDITGIFLDRLHQPHLQVNGSNNHLLEVFGEDYANCIEEYFNLIHCGLIFCADLLLIRGHDCGIYQSSTLCANVFHLSCFCLKLCRERDPLRSILRTIQSLFSPTTFKQNTDGSSANNMSELLLQEGFAFGSELVSQLLQVLAEGTVSSLCPNLTEALQAIITAFCCSNRTVKPGVQLAEECRGWVRENFHRIFLNIPSRSQGGVVNALLRFAETRDRRFRSIMQDLGKIAVGEMTDDALLVYVDSV